MSIIAVKPAEATVWSMGEPVIVPAVEMECGACREVRTPLIQDEAAIARFVDVHSSCKKGAVK